MFQTQDTCMNAKYGSELANKKHDLLISKQIKVFLKKNHD